MCSKVCRWTRSCGRGSARTLGRTPAGRLNHPASVVEHNGHVNDLVQEKRTATVGSRLSSHRQQRICWTCTTNIDHLVNVLQLENLSGKPWESASPPRQRCRRHAANTAHLALHNNGHVTILSKNCNCGTPRAALSGPKPLSCTTRARHQNDDHNKDIEHRIKRLQLGNLCGLL